MSENSADPQPFKDRDATREFGVGGVNISLDGRVWDDPLALLRGPRRFKWLRDFRDDDPTVGGVMNFMSAWAQQVEWRVAENPDGDPEDAEFLHQNLFEDLSHPFADVPGNAVEMIAFGFMPFEMVFKRRDGKQKRGSKKHSSRFSDGKIGLHAIAVRAPETIDRWHRDEDTNEVLGMWQMCAPHYNDTYLPIEKMLVFRTSTERANPEGRPAIRNAFVPWYRLRRFLQIEGVGIERNLAGMPVVDAPPELMQADATPEQKQALFQIEKMVKAIRADEQGYAIIPALYDDNGNRLFDLRLLAPGAKVGADAGPTIKRLKEEIATALNADSLLLGQGGGGGSHALSNDKTKMFSIFMGLVLARITDELNRHLVPMLFELNGRSTENLPTIVHGDVERPDLGKFAAALSSLTASGMPLLPDVAVEEYAREVIGLPPKDAAAVEEVKKQIEFGYKQNEIQREIAMADLEAQLKQSQMAAEQAAMAPVEGEAPAEGAAEVPNEPTAVTDPLDQPLNEAVAGLEPNVVEAQEGEQA